MLDEEEDDADEKSGDKPKKNKKIRRDLASLKKQKNDPNAPTATRMPLPDLRDSDKAEKAKALREIFRRQDLSSNLPSIIYYTVLNSCSTPSAVEICDDSRLVSTISHISFQHLTKIVDKLLLNLLLISFQYYGAWFYKCTCKGMDIKSAQT